MSGAIKPLRHLIAEAAAIGGGNLCVAGHDWKFEGGRACPNMAPDRDGCSMSVYRCDRCGGYDYGDKGGPGDVDCMACPNRVAA